MNVGFFERMNGDFYAKYQIHIFPLPSSAIVSKMQKKGINVILGVH